ncbi:hypothetical protein TNCV_3261181 [Trichonephila clavipes]|nr:hypothetical protein TNCV_3261181 [Trichonephila clavipes]
MVQNRVANSLRVAEQSDVNLHSFTLKQHKGFGSHHFEPRSRDKEDTSLSLLPHYTNEGRWILVWFNVHQPPLHGISSAALGANSNGIIATVVQVQTCTDTLAPDTTDMV